MQLAIDAIDADRYDVARAEKRRHEQQCAYSSWSHTGAPQGGLTTGNKRKIERGKPRGVPASAMTVEQRGILMKLVREHIGRIRKELADQDLARIDRAGAENIHFVWAGGLVPGQPHHYLIQGPTFLIEYDNTQDEANHLHCVYRDFDNDFGDAMLEHYRKHHDHKH